MNRRLLLPSGAVAVRDEGGRYHFGPVSTVVLSRADVETLFADSIAGDGGREVPDITPAARVVILRALEAMGPHSKAQCGARVWNPCLEFLAPCPLHSLRMLAEVPL